MAEASLSDDAADMAAGEVSSEDSRAVAVEGAGVEAAVQEELQEVLEDALENKIYKKHDPEKPCDRSQDAYNYEKSWYDESQIYVNSVLCEPAVWFDNFFADDRVFAEGRPGTYVRWRNEFIYDEREGFDYKMRLSFSAELPGLQRRARITFENEEDQELRDITPGSSEDTPNSLGLQVDVKENVRSKFNVSLNLSPRLRLRYRYTYPAAQDITLRFTQELERDSGINGARSLFDFEKLLKQNVLFRSSTEAKFSDEYDGSNWLQAFVLFHRLNHKTSLSYESSVTGVTQPEDSITNYRLGVRFRKNFHREWLFYEIAPEVTWPLLIDEVAGNPEVARHSNWLLFFRLEVHFGNASKRSYRDYFP
jgi:hypothetical protein